MYDDLITVRRVTDSALNVVELPTRRDVLHGSVSEGPGHQIPGGRQVLLAGWHDLIGRQEEAPLRGRRRRQFDRQRGNAALAVGPVDLRTADQVPQAKLPGGVLPAVHGAEETGHVLRHAAQQTIVRCCKGGVAPGIDHQLGITMIA